MCVTLEGWLEATCKEVIKESAPVVRAHKAQTSFVCRIIINPCQNSFSSSGIKSTGSDMEKDQVALSMFMSNVNLQIINLY